MVFNLEDEIPEPLVELVLPEDLDSRGKYELVKCLFPLKKMTPGRRGKRAEEADRPAGQGQRSAASQTDFGAGNGGANCVRFAT